MLSTTLPLLLLGVLGARATRAGEPAPVLRSAVFNLVDLAVKPTEVGERRDVARQSTATLDEFECHLSVLNAGRPSHPPHQHPQEELIILQEGTLEVFINGHTARIGPGSLFFFAAHDRHAVANVGSTPARYSVFNFTTGQTRRREARPAAETSAPGQLRSGVYTWESLTALPTKVGHRRAVFDSPTPTCARLECHITTLNAGEAPHAPHHHPDEEMILVRDGTMEVTIQGRSHRLTAGGIAFLASNEEHGFRNVGGTAATYYVIRVATERTPAKPGA
jgi:quercetin dioxygenase-like cupin family protein